MDENDLSRSGIEVRYEVIHTRRVWDDRAIEALVELHSKYNTNPLAKGRDIAPNIGPELGITGFLNDTVSWEGFLHSNCQALGEQNLTDLSFFERLEDIPDIVVHPNSMSPRIEEVDV